MHAYKRCFLVHAVDANFAYRHQLHYGKLVGEPLAFGPVKDMALSAGFDLNTKNTASGQRGGATSGSSNNDNNCIQL